MAAKSLGEVKATAKATRMVMMTGLRGVVGGGGIVIVDMRFWVMIGRLRGVVFGWASIALSTFAVDCSGMVTSAKIFIEDCSIWTVEGVLLSISMAVVINLASSFWVSIMPVRVGSFPAVKASISVMSGNGDWLDFFGLIGSLVKHDRSFWLVMVMVVSRGPIGITGWWSISRLRFIAITRLRLRVGIGWGLIGWGLVGLIWLLWLVSRFRVVSRFRLVVSRLMHWGIMWGSWGILPWMFIRIWSMVIFRHFVRQRLVSKLGYHALSCGVVKAHGIDAVELHSHVGRLGHFASSLGGYFRPEQGLFRAPPTLK